MKTTLIFKILVFAIALYTNVRVVSSQSANHKVYFRYNNKQLLKELNQTEFELTSIQQHKKFRKTSNLKTSNLQNWFIDSKEWVNINSEKEVKLEKWMLNASELTKTNSFENKNESYVLEDWMFNTKSFYDLNIDEKQVNLKDWMLSAKKW